jgi:hypothetical protein
MATWAAGATAVNAVVGTIVVVIVYNALRPALKKSGIFFVIGRKEEKEAKENKVYKEKEA